MSYYVYDGVWLRRPPPQCSLCPHVIPALHVLLAEPFSKVLDEDSIDLCLVGPFFPVTKKRLIATLWASLMCSIRVPRWYKLRMTVSREDPFLSLSYLHFQLQTLK
jgi:hypothetical protein